LTKRFSDLHVVATKMSAHNSVLLYSSWCLQLCLSSISGHVNYSSVISWQHTESVYTCCQNMAAKGVMLRYVPCVHWQNRRKSQ